MIKNKETVFDIQITYKSEINVYIHTYIFNESIIIFLYTVYASVGLVAINVFIMPVFFRILEDLRF